MPEPGDQVGQNSCVGWAVSYLNTYQEKKEEDWSLNDRDHVFSPSFIYNQINGGEDAGSFIDEAFELVQEKGVAPWSLMPYDDLDFTSQPSDDASAEAKKYRIRPFRRVDDINQAKAQLATGSPLVVCIAMDSSLALLDPGEVYDRFGRGRRGRHAICLVGYDNNMGSSGAFKFINSWGSGWSDGGYGWVSYDWVAQHGTELYVAVDLPNDIAPPDITPPDDNGNGPTPAMTIYSEADARVSPESPDVNFGKSETLDLGDVDWAYIRFDLTEVQRARDEAGDPKEALLTLSFRGEGIRVTGVTYRAGGAWREETITWNNRPLKTGGGVNFSIPATHPMKSYAAFTFDIVGAWLNGSPNHGLVMWLDEPTDPNKALLLDIKSRDNDPRDIKLVISW